jgi:hypothetical protein
VAHPQSSPTRRLSYQHTQILLDIQVLYDQQDSMLAADRRLFTQPYDYWLTKPTSPLKTFLLRMKPSVKTSILQAADMGANFRTIDNYFPPAIPQLASSRASHQSPTSLSSWRDLDPPATRNIVFTTLLTQYHRSLQQWPVCSHLEICVEEDESNVAPRLLRLWTDR